MGEDVLLHLLVSFGHEENLNRKSIALWLIVKEGQKGIVCKLLQDQFAIEHLGQTGGQGGLATAYIPLNADIPIW